MSAVTLALAAVDGLGVGVLVGRLVRSRLRGDAGRAVTPLVTPAVQPPSTPAAMRVITRPPVPHAPADASIFARIPSDPTTSRST